MGLCIMVSLSMVVVHSPLKYEKELLFLLEKEVYKLIRKKMQKETYEIQLHQYFKEMIK